MDDTGRVIIIIAAGGGLLVSIVAQLVVLLVLVRSWIDKAMAKHFLHEHILDRGTGETLLRRQIRCDSNCPVVHPHGDGGRPRTEGPGRYHVRGSR